MQVDNTSMYHQLNEIKKTKNNPHSRAMERRKIIHAVTLLIAVFSAMNMYSASFYDRSFVIKKHLIFLVAGYGMAALSVLVFEKNRSKIYRIFENTILQYLIMFFSSALLIAVGLIAENVKGAKVWLYIGGISIQPAEILKIAFIVNIAHFLRIRCEEKSKSIPIVLGMLVFLIMYCGPIIVVQNDTGTALHYVAIAGFMLFMSNISKKWIIGIIGSGITVLTTGFYLIYKYIEIDHAKYSLRRIKGYLVGLFFGDYSSDVSHQVGQGLIAFGSGGIGGKGYGNGVQKYSYIPEVHTDFIMSSFGEEFGFIGMVVLCIVFYILFHTIMKVAEDSSDDLFGRYIVTGIAGMIMTQFFINLFVATGLFPVFGIPMPFFSSGGTSLIALFVSILIVHMINNASLTKQ
jgi:cell division protein FtsW